MIHTLYNIATKKYVHCVATRITRQKTEVWVFEEDIPNKMFLDKKKADKHLTDVRKAVKWWNTNRPQNEYMNEMKAYLKDNMIKVVTLIPNSI